MWFDRQIVSSILFEGKRAPNDEAYWPQTDLWEGPFNQRFQIYPASDGCLKHGLGMSIKRSALNAKTTIEVNCSANLWGLIVQVPWRLVRLAIAFNFNSIRALLYISNFWAYIFAFDCANNHFGSYLHLGVRILVIAGTRNFHLLKFLFAKFTHGEWFLTTSNEFYSHFLVMLGTRSCFLGRQMELRTWQAKGRAL